MNKHHLTLVGTGIKTVSHITKEAEAYIASSELVLYLVNEPNLKGWIVEKAEHKSECLDSIYFATEDRKTNYDNISRYIEECVDNHHSVCLVMYGHPTVFAQPAINAARACKDKGHNVQVLPGISAENCLYADLLVDPGTHGTKALEASDLLIRNRVLDNTCHTIIWQIGVIGNKTTDFAKDNKPGLKVLSERLLNDFDAKHPCYVYEAAMLPHLSPVIVETTIGELPSANTSPVSTLYIPPSSECQLDVDVCKSIGFI